MLNTKVVKLVKCLGVIFKLILGRLFRVTSIADLLEREGETSSAALVKRLAQLEEQVGTWFLVGTDVAPLSVTCHVTCGF